VFDGVISFYHGPQKVEICFGYKSALFLDDACDL
jgi:hypothetical protein